MYTNKLTQNQWKLQICNFIFQVPSIEVCFTLKRFTAYNRLQNLTYLLHH